MDAGFRWFCDDPAALAVPGVRIEEVQRVGETVVGGADDFADVGLGAAPRPTSIRRRP